VNPKREVRRKNYPNHLVRKKKKHIFVGLTVKAEDNDRLQITSVWDF
jgi:ribosomal protein S3AE